MSAPSGLFERCPWARAPTFRTRPSPVSPSRRPPHRHRPRHFADLGNGGARAMVGLPFLAAKPPANVPGGPSTGRVMQATETRKSVRRQPRSRAIPRMAEMSAKGVDGRRCCAAAGRQADPARNVVPGSRPRDHDLCDAPRSWIFSRPCVSVLRSAVGRVMQAIGENAQSQCGFFSVSVPPTTLLSRG